MCVLLTDPVSQNSILDSESPTKTLHYPVDGRSVLPIVGIHEDEASAVDSWDIERSRAARNFPGIGRR